MYSRSPILTHAFKGGPFSPRWAEPPKELPAEGSTLDVHVTISAEAKAVLEKAETLFVDREAQRKAKEAWIEEQARLTQNMFACYSPNYSNQSDVRTKEEAEEEDMLAYFPSDYSLVDAETGCSLTFRSDEFP